MHWKVQAGFGSTGTGIAMYVCICHGVTDHEIRSAVAAGTSDIENVAMLLGVGTTCGCCRQAAQDVIAAAQECASGCCRLES